MSESSQHRRLFVLDTNVLMHDPSAIFRFQEHDIFLPMVVLEELDRGKKGTSEVARNVRQASRFLDQLMAGVSKREIDAGLPLPAPGDNPNHGHLFFQTRHLPNLLPETRPGNTPDNNILGTTLALREEFPENDVILVSKDINLRIKAAVLGIRAEDYFNDQVLNDVDLLYSGEEELLPDFWERHASEIDSWKEEGRTFYRVNGPDVEHWYPNQCLYAPGETHFEVMVRVGDDGAPMIELVLDYRSERHAVWGINARNREQNFALNMLMDPATTWRC
jgi:PhoH-like ATPase